ncbi:MAG: class I SAM-dependent methyltransferase [Chloroflexota bacterium]
MSIYDEMVARYDSGQIPWDDPLPPPEVIEIIEIMPPDKALDLGCGHGRASIYLAQKGWQVDGIDFVPQAITVARQRAIEAKVQPQFHCASVTDLDFLRGSYKFALDVGCCHALTPQQLEQYHQHLKRLIPVAGIYLLFARIQQPEGASKDNQKGISLQTIKNLFEDGFHLEKMVEGRTNTEDGEGWASAWFWYRRLE